MATSISSGLDQLNNADLSRLRGKLDTLRKEIEEAMRAKNDASRNANSPTTPSTADVAKAAASMGITPDELLRALEWAKKRT